MTITESSKRSTKKAQMKSMLNIAFMLGWQDVRQAYRRSSIGPLWLTISMLVQITTMSLVFSLIFKISLNDYLPFLTVSMLVWSLISSSVADGCNALISAESLIKQMRMQSIVFTFRVIWKNLIQFAHNLVLLPIVFMLFSSHITPIMFLAIPGLILLVLNLIWLITLLSFACARFRDLGPIVNSLLTIAYFLTPIMWQPGSLGNTSLAHLLLGLNPLYHLIQICRQPLVGLMPTQENWIAATVILVVGMTLTRMLYKKLSHRMAFWV